MMDARTWCARIVEALSKLSDTDYQKAAWLSSSSDTDSPTSSFVELSCLLFDDYDLPGFRDRYLPGMACAEKLNELFSELDNALSRVPAPLNDSEILASTEWNEVITIANEAKRLLASECERLV